jgi:hypothetical protein
MIAPSGVPEIRQAGRITRRHLHGGAKLVDSHSIMNFAWRSRPYCPLCWITSSVSTPPKRCQAWPSNFISCICSIGKKSSGLVLIVFSKVIETDSRNRENVIREANLQLD